ncbi:hypothetical protein QBC40DRAFT_294900 [Triangularia verruculosa]|uniref:HIG1 domain-containing protein n=1 Tax=Triangularia verruculosa TaxID=2587418 RepID=A0AAN7AXL0_9PEZI|nr:hypothetical protein QBC40DRAFT_294900 [Triangularia verruculosa]
MKIISKEEEEAHFKVVLKGGVIGGTVGLAVGYGTLIAASKRYSIVRNLTLPFRSFLVSSAGTFGAMVWAERHSIQFQRSHDAMHNYIDASHKAAAEARAATRTDKEKLMDWGRENRYSIVFASWIAAMGLAMAMVGKNKYLSGSQKLVQARVYAQGLTVAVLIATAAFETADAKAGKGRWETVMVVDPDDPEHKHLIEKRVRKEDYEGQNLWQDMVEAEERRMAKQKKERDILEKEGKAHAS